jgi:hypothetical protein
MNAILLSSIHWFLTSFLIPFPRITKLAEGINFKNLFGTEKPQDLSGKMKRAM